MKKLKVLTDGGAEAGAAGAAATPADGAFCAQAISDAQATVVTSSAGTFIAQSFARKSSWQALQLRVSLPNWSFTTAVSPAAATRANSLASLLKLDASSPTFWVSLNSSGFAPVSCRPLPCSVPAGKSGPRLLARARIVVGA